MVRYPGSSPVRVAESRGAGFTASLRASTAGDDWLLARRRQMASVRPPVGGAEVSRYAEAVPRTPGR
jgi:hypothetical protein